jgi:diguanylate cyclase (GGDEF)-like protein
MELEESMEERLSGVASLAATALDSVTLLEEVRHQALHDPVTELANSRLFEDRVTQSLATTRRSGRRLAMLFVDLDRFKIVNDVHGHKVGDELLRAVAERLLLTVRDEDTVARIGGDEFGLIVQHAATRDAAEVVAQRIISAMDEPFDVHGLTLSIGVSIGVTMYPDAFDT